MSTFWKKLKRVKYKDILQIWKLPVSILPAMVYRCFQQDLWIICEDEMEARDNGYWFFKQEQEVHFTWKSYFPSFSENIYLNIHYISLSLKSLKVSQNIKLCLYLSYINVVLLFITK